MVNSFNHHTLLHMSHLVQFRIWVLMIRSQFGSQLQLNFELSNQRKPSNYMKMLKNQLLQSL
jgi:hypothetical protein